MIDIGTWVEYPLNHEKRIGKINDTEKDAQGEFVCVDIYRFKKSDVRVLTKKEAIIAELKGEQITPISEALKQLREHREK